MKRFSGKKLLAHVALIAVGFFWMYPFLWMISASLKTPTEMFGRGLSLIPESLQFENYVRAWKVANFSGYFLNTVVVTTAVVLIVIFLTSTCGYVLRRFNFPGKTVIIALVVATVFLPTRYTIIPIFDLVKRLGLLNSLGGLILVGAGTQQALFILLFSSFFRGLPKELEESAIIDGAGFLQVFARIMLPLSTPVIATVTIFQFITSWNDFLFPLILTLRRPSLRTLGVGMYAFVGEHTFDWTGAAAGAAISLVPVMTIFLIFQKWFISGVVGAVKG